MSSNRSLYPVPNSVRIRSFPSFSKASPVATTGCGNFLYRLLRRISVARVCSAFDDRPRTRQENLSRCAWYEKGFCCRPHCKRRHRCNTSPCASAGCYVTYSLGSSWYREHLAIPTPDWRVDIAHKPPRVQCNIEAGAYVRIYKVVVEL